MGTSNLKVMKGPWTAAAVVVVVVALSISSGSRAMELDPDDAKIENKVPNPAQPEQVHRSCEMCGSSGETNWPHVSHSPYYNRFKPETPDKRDVKDVARDLSKYEAYQEYPTRRKTQHQRNQQEEQSERMEFIHYPAPLTRFLPIQHHPQSPCPHQLGRDLWSPLHANGVSNQHNNIYIGGQGGSNQGRALGGSLPPHGGPSQNGGCGGPKRGVPGGACGGPAQQPGAYTAPNMWLQSGRGGVYGGPAGGGAYAAGSYGGRIGPPVGGRGQQFGGMAGGPQPPAYGAQHYMQQPISLAELMLEHHTLGSSLT